MVATSSVDVTAQRREEYNVNFLAGSGVVVVTSLWKFFVSALKWHRLGAGSGDGGTYIRVRKRADYLNIASSPGSRKGEGEGKREPGIQRSRMRQNRRGCDDHKTK